MTRLVPCGSPLIQPRVGSKRRPSFEPILPSRPPVRAGADGKPTKPAIITRGKEVTF